MRVSVIEGEDDDVPDDKWRYEKGRECGLLREVRLRVVLLRV
jgi:hypothetical protein